MNGATLTKLLTTTVILSMLLVFATPVTAQEEGFYFERNIAEQYTSETAIIASSAVTREGSDWIIFALDTNSDGKGLGVGALYGHGNTASENKWATGTFMAPFCIVEFVDDGDGKYDLRADDVVSVLPLHKDMQESDDFYRQTGESPDTMTWLDRPGYKTVRHERTTGPKDVVEVQIEAETTDGVFTLRMHIANSVIFAPNVTLSPYEVKIDFIIEDYPYQANDTILAFCNIVAVGNAVWDSGLPEEYDDWRTTIEEKGLYFDLGDVSEGAGYFSWYRNATLDGVETQVEDTTLAQFSQFKWENDRTTKVDLKYVAFTYGRADSIVHDPKLGYVFEGLPVILERLTRGNIGLFMFSIILFVGLVGTARWARRRSSKPQRVESIGKNLPPSPPQAPPQVPPGTPPTYPPQTPPPTAPPQGGAPPQTPPGNPPGGSQWGQYPQAGDPRYGYRPPGQ